MNDEPKKSAKVTVISYSGHIKFTNPIDSSAPQVIKLRDIKQKIYEKYSSVDAVFSSQQYGYIVKLRTNPDGLWTGTYSHHNSNDSKKDQAINSIVFIKQLDNLSISGSWVEADRDWNMSIDAKVIETSEFDESDL